jgi:NADP-dependent 3-hydroxy acid dehydrogenase YdfG
MSINASSIAPHLMSSGASGYQTEKSAVNRFMEFLHFEYEAEGVRLLIILVSVCTFSLG